MTNVKDMKAEEAGQYTVVQANEFMITKIPAASAVSSALNMSFCI
jgi:hypothetical protein